MIIRDGTAIVIGRVRARAPCRDDPDGPVWNADGTGAGCLCRDWGNRGTSPADPATDWASVDIEALRQHLLDMDNVTMRREVVVEPVPGEASFRVTSSDVAVANSIRRMVTAHAETMNGSAGWQMTASSTDTGADLTATGDEVRFVPAASSG